MLEKFYFSVLQMEKEKLQIFFSLIILLDVKREGSFNLRARNPNKLLSMKLDGWTVLSATSSKEPQDLPRSLKQFIDETFTIK